MIKNKKIVIIMTLIIIVILGIVLYYVNNKDYNYTDILENNKYDIVYDRISSYKDRVPYININNDNIKKINQEIETMYNEYLIFSPDGFNYQYNVSKEILSIIITAYVVKPESTHYDIIYKSYNINLKDFKVLSNKEILNRFNISEKKMEYYLYNKFINYYSDLISKKYFTEAECDFNCFLESKNVENLLDDNYYYINDNHLELYKNFNIFTDYKEENYFNESSFHFIVT